jgi:hypothetical protein
MKTRQTVILTALAIVLATTALAQHGHDAKKTGGMKSHSMTTMMGAPAFDRSVDSLRIQVWIITQEAHKRMMSEQMKGDMKGEMKGMMHGKEEQGEMHSMDHRSMDAMMSGTHHIMVSLTDEKTKVETDSAKVDVRTVSPSKKSSTTELSKMKGHLGGGIVLDEKGEYTLGLKIETGGRSITQEFRYTTVN